MEARGREQLRKAARPGPEAGVVGEAAQWLYPICDGFTLAFGCVRCDFSKEKRFTGYRSLFAPVREAVCMVEVHVLTGPERRRSFSSPQARPSCSSITATTLAIVVLVLDEADLGILVVPTPPGSGVITTPDTSPG
jgi:hypothetical protein